MGPQVDLAFDDDAWDAATASNSHADPTTILVIKTIEQLQAQKESSNNDSHQSRITEAGLVISNRVGYLFYGSESKRHPRTATSDQFNARSIYHSTVAR